MRMSDWSSDVCSSVLPSWRANAQPIEPQSIATSNPILRIEWQELSQRQLRAAIQHVALELGDNERQPRDLGGERSEEHTSELQSLMRSSYAVFCLKKKTRQFHKI